MSQEHSGLCNRVNLFFSNKYKLLNARQFTIGSGDRTGTVVYAVGFQHPACPDHCFDAARAPTPFIQVVTEPESASLVKAEERRRIAPFPTLRILALPVVAPGHENIGPTKSMLPPTHRKRSPSRVLASSGTSAARLTSGTATISDAAFRSSKSPPIHRQPARLSGPLFLSRCAAPTCRKQCPDSRPRSPP